MIIDLIRTYCGDKYTIGKLFVNGRYFCDTLEDPVRDLNQNGVFDNGETKIKGASAIPYGTYHISLDSVSARFKNSPQYRSIGGKLPRLLNVPHFDGILIHCGNTEADTSGCILVGQNLVKGHLLNSTAIFHKLYLVMKTYAESGEVIMINILRP